MGYVHTNWCTENPHVVLEEELNQPGVCVWGGIHGGGLVGPCFFEHTVNGANYLELLEDLRGELDGNAELANIEHFMQAGAPHIMH